MVVIIALVRLAAWLVPAALIDFSTRTSAVPVTTSYIRLELAPAPPGLHC